MLALIVFCKRDPTALEAIVNGVIAWAGILGGATALGTGLTAAALAFDRKVSADQRADAINRGLGAGFLAGAIVGLCFFVAFAAKIVT